MTGNDLPLSPNNNDASMPPLPKAVYGASAKNEPEEAFALPPPRRMITRGVTARNGLRKIGK